MATSVSKMFRLILVSALVAVAFGSPRIRPRVPMLDGRIVGGNEANIEDLPYQLSLQYYSTHICGASIISETRALTAAHCTDGSTAVQLNIRASSSIRGSGGQVVDVRSICQHPNYDSWNIDNDVSVLVLSSSISLGSGAQPVALAAVGSDVAEGAAATVSGWGATSQGGSLPSRLQAIQVPRITDANCKAAYGSSSITDQMICFGLNVVAGSWEYCQGDSGGPLVTVSDGVQVGVVSWGYGCTQPNYPDVYAKVAALRSHIDSC